MEALAAVALAGNILQFVETTKKLISATGQLSHLGSSEEHIELSSLVHELQGWVLRVTPRDPPQGVKLSEEEKSIRALGVQCNQVANQLLGVLESLKSKNDSGNFGYIESFYLALLGEWKKGEIDALLARLDRIGDNIQKHLASYDSKQILGRLDDLESENRRLEAHRTGEIQGLRKQFDELFSGIKDALQKEDSREHTIAALLSAAAQGSRYSAEQMILEHIRFESINDRHDTIRVAHKQTLSWLFSTGERRSPATFDDWLVSDDDIYWVSGKPGSGKSTLLKFLSRHSQTMAKLDIWAKQKRLIHAEYFFWNAGKQKLQKSQEGLLRSLVYQILRQCPEMIPKAYPNTWRLCFPEDMVAPYEGSGSTSSSAIIPLSVKGLLATLRVIGATALESESKLCFFIDGLDEYEGKPSDMIDMVRILQTLPNVKLCLSSRAWNEFRQAFGKEGTRMLYMEDFNRDDISSYVYDTFARDENYQQLEDRDTSGKALVDEIVEAANGVFLWVYLVVRSFQEGLLNCDRILDLRRRLDALPKDLNEYFERILLSDVADFYHGQSAEMFSVTLEGAEDLPLIAYWFMGNQGPSDALTLEPNPLSPQKLNQRFKAVKTQLNACCKGLLEVQDLPPRAEEASLPSIVLFNRKVNFLHRTVRDFLLLDDTQRILQRWYSPAFDPHESICRALLADIKVAPVGREYWGGGGPVSRLCDLFYHHAHILASRNWVSSVPELCNSLDTVLDLRGAKDLKKNEVFHDEKPLEDQASESTQQIPESQRDVDSDDLRTRIRRSLGKIPSKWPKKK
ncbi:hypothetical protein NW767_015565 [Fusarium falciforme]|uniref:NACHT domain-containing protein n=1 Tax=Fusarium falciforme TaxID=195108 RepID=A0A9W8QR61_9HYPO|nr:hypothetical protein NW767_015565 [Fusarium falciforme]KAJ4176703.1 hypothetical protein NW755_014269 [Fusarium falciforme]KAJ4181553.1 hypothetical protein NW759_017175 [Fusarium solani]KAJ4217893.1 hypothetical protein NW757_014620 [Fusarium falciforme]